MNRALLSLTLAILSACLSRAASPTGEQRGGERVVSGRFVAFSFAGEW
jgi:hypothetical protein